jgi:MYXO-CTERM domain-containing protein
VLFVASTVHALDAGDDGGDASADAETLDASGDAVADASDASRPDTGPQCCPSMPGCQPLPCTYVPDAGPVDDDGGGEGGVVTNGGCSCNTEGGMGSASPLLALGLVLTLRALSRSKR